MTRIKRYIICLSCFMPLTGFTSGLSLQSPAFMTNTAIPSLYTCNGSNYSPPLVWDDPNIGTQSYVLIVEDPDAPSGSWIHWIVFNIPSQIRQLKEATPIPEGATSGQNSWNITGYSGPCPPIGTHHYIFKLYALDSFLSLDYSATYTEVMQAMQNNIIDSTELVGLYSKQ